MGLFTALFGDANEKAIKKLIPLRDKVLALEETYRAMSTEELKAQPGGPLISPVSLF